MKDYLYAYDIDRTLIRCIQLKDGRLKVDNIITDMNDPGVKFEVGEVFKPDFDYVFNKYQLIEKIFGLSVKK